MANFLYDIAREGFLTEIAVGVLPGAKLDWINDDLRVALVEGTYVGNESAHIAYNEISASVAADVPLAGRVSDGAGTASATSTVFIGVPSGDPVTCVVIYKTDTPGFVPTTATEAPLVVHLDDAVANLPITPNGGDITVIWNSGSGEIFRL